jgi:molecular chaperone DnaK (HSP70)
MSAPNDAAQRVAIGISFGNSYSSIAYTTGVSAARTK